MTEITRKICLLGEFGVGKTSLAGRFVHATFSDEYLTTVGAKVDTKVVVVDGKNIKLAVWDIAGTDNLAAGFKSYLRGAAGYLLVADGTRAYTLDFAKRVNSMAQESGQEIPCVGLVNKADLADQWELGDDDLAAAGGTWLRTSAKTGENVEQAFLDLAKAIESRCV